MMVSARNLFNSPCKSAISGSVTASPLQCAADARALRAAIACSSRFAATARQLPTRTAATPPGSDRTAASSSETSFAPWCGGRTTLAKTIPRKPHILYVGRRSGQLSGQVDPIDRFADDGIVARLLRRSFACDVSLQQVGICACDFPESRTLPVRRSDNAGLGLQIFWADAEPPCSRRKKNAARLGACRPNGVSTLLDRLTTEGVLLVRPSSGIGGYHADLLKPPARLFARHLIT